MKVLIIEDEELAVRKLEKILAGMEKPIQIVGITDSCAGSDSHGYRIGRWAKF
jgi:DNA-binding LytR/AlgR family response regulator